MTFLSPAERHTLALLCDTLLPALQPDDGAADALFRLSANDFDLAAHMETALALITDAPTRAQLRLFLRAIESGAFNQLAAGQRGRFSTLSHEQREAVLRAWSQSELPAARKTFQSLKRLAMFLFYTVTPDGNRNPAWNSFGYKPPTPRPEPAERPIRPLRISAPTSLTCDALVIGSGAGGGVVAAELAEAGLDVLIVEKGEYRADADFTGRELETHERLFEKRGSLATDDLAILILAGSTLGGGTVVNWAASFRTPDSVLAEWERDYGFDGACSPEFARSLAAVMARIGVTEAWSDANPQNCALERGCHALGYHVGVIARNVRDCVECGFCNFGCAHGAKQSTLKTYLIDACERGARILTQARVERVMIERGQAVGAVVTVRDESGIPNEVVVHAKMVIAAGGAIHTPALLRRSGLRNPHVGANLHLHPTTSIYGLFEQPVRGWQGAPMTRISSQFADMDGRGYGVRLETAPVHPGLAGLAASWESARQHRRVMAQLDHLANIIILTRDQDGGRVGVNREGNPVIYYRLSRRDAAHLLRGTVEALRVHHAAGAYEVSSPHTPPLVWRADGSRWDNFQVYLEAVFSRGYRRHGFALFSAHQMSSCRIAGSAKLGAVKPSGETYEVRNLFVADGSVLPTASGVNPMVTIMGTAHYLAQQIKAAVRG